MFTEQSKICSVSNCNFNTEASKDIRFVCVPKKVAERKQWLKRIQSDKIEPHMYCCELHFDLQSDCTGDADSSNQRFITLKPGVIPHKNLPEPPAKKARKSSSKVGKEFLTESEIAERKPKKSTTKALLKKPISAKGVRRDGKSKKNGDSSKVTKSTYQIGKPENNVPTQSSSAMHCGVPGCANRSPEWTVTFPSDKILMERWRAAIQAGTGLCPPGDDSVICNVHFVTRHPSEASQGIVDGRREPSLFFRDNVQLRVACCRLCFQHGTTENMFNIGGCSGQGYSLRQMIEKCFGMMKFDSIEEEYLCERCTVQLDVTNSFLMDIEQRQAKQTGAAIKIKTEEDTVMHGDYALADSLQDANADLDQQYHKQDAIFEDIIVKEETQLAEP